MLPVAKIFLAAMKDAKRAKLKDARLLVILYNLALFYHQQKRPKKAEVLLERALEHAESLFGKNANPVNHILNRLADLQIKERHYKKAEGFYDRSLQIERRIFAADNPLLAKKLMKVAWIQALLGNYDDSESYLKQALELQIMQHALNALMLPAARRRICHMMLICYSMILLVMMKLKFLIHLTDRRIIHSSGAS